MFAQGFKKMVELFRRLMQRLFTRPVVAVANKISSAPDKEAVFTALSKLYEDTMDSSSKKADMLQIDPHTTPVIIFSDHHKGNKNGCDDFTLCEPQYLAALDYYFGQGYYYINLGDSEELWENNILSVLKHNKSSFEKEKLFVEAGKHCKIYGNHDNLWRFDPLAPQYLKQMYGSTPRVYGGILLRCDLANNQQLDIFCAHGHQGDAKSDGNLFSAWFVANIWAPFQSFLRVNTNTPSSSNELKTLHNQMMYEWSAAQQQLVLITGHTHQPVFNSLTHLERLYLALEEAIEKKDRSTVEKLEREIPRREKEYKEVNMYYKTMKPTYFNAGCCCFSDGTITGIEIAGDSIRLVKWSHQNGKPTRIVAEETSLAELAKKI